MTEHEAIDMMKDRMVERCMDCIYRFKGIDGQSYCSVDGFHKDMFLCLDVHFCEYAQLQQRADNYPENFDYQMELIDFLNGKVKDSIKKYERKTL